MRRFLHLLATHLVRVSRTEHLIWGLHALHELAGAQYLIRRWYLLLHQVAGVAEHIVAIELTLIWGSKPLPKLVHLVHHVAHVRGLLGGWGVILELLYVLLVVEIHALAWARLLLDLHAQ